MIKDLEMRLSFVDTKWIGGSPRITLEEGGSRLYKQQRRRHWETGDSAVMWSYFKAHRWAPELEEEECLSLRALQGKSVLLSIKHFLPPLNSIPCSSGYNPVWRQGLSNSIWSCCRGAGVLLRRGNHRHADTQRVLLCEDRSARQRLSVGSWGRPVQEKACYTLVLPLQ